MKHHHHRVAERHGFPRNSPEYQAWIAMRRRCLKPGHPAYKNYGGRGITICERWTLFSAFFADMGPRPSHAHSLDRKDNEGPYAPWNCRWATLSEQHRNVRPRQRDALGRYCGGVVNA